MTAQRKDEGARELSIGDQSVKDESAKDGSGKDGSGKDGSGKDGSGKGGSGKGGSGKGGLLSRVTARLARTESELEASELRDHSDRLGAQPIAELVDRSEVTVSGAVRSVTLRPRVNVPALVVEVFDGTKTLNLVWLGRRRIGGIVPGTYLTVHGRVTYRHGIPTIFNPAYEIRPDRGR